MKAEPEFPPVLVIHYDVTCATEIRLGGVPVIFAQSTNGAIHRIIHPNLQAEQLKYIGEQIGIIQLEAGYFPF